MATSHAIEVEFPSRDGSGDSTLGSVLFIGTATVLIRYAGFHGDRYSFEVPAPVKHMTRLAG